MLARRKEEKSHRRKRKNIINYNDDIIAQLLLDMRNAAEEDRKLCLQNKPAINKIAMLPKVLENKHVLQSVILKHNVLSVFTEWLTRIQNGSPYFKIRNNLLKLLSEFSGIDKVSLKRSGIGKAVMHLHKHPKETKSNKEQTRKLVESWLQPIFNSSMDLRTLDELRDERMQKDLEQSLQKRRKVEIKESSLIKNNKKDSENNEELHDFDEVLRGDFMPSYLDPRDLESGRDIERSQAPEPSQRIYLIRPQSHVTRWKLHVDINKNKNQLWLRRIANRFLKNKRRGSVQRAVNISIDGRKCL